jgi:magnesium-transporting ATPase (P-type)
VFCQVFNEWNAKSLTDEWNVFHDVFTNRIFLLITFWTVGLQLFLVYVGGEFVQVTPLSLEQFLITMALGLIAFPVGIIMRFIPVTEDPDCYFDNSAAPSNKIIATAVAKEV